MSEERFDRLDSQLSQVIHGMTVMQQNMATKQDLAVIEQKVSVIEQKVSVIEQKVSVIEQKVSEMQDNLDATREDIFSLRTRIDSVEGAVSVVIRNTFTTHQSFVDDLNFDLTNQERKIRRLSRRVVRLERIDLDDD
jgi:predicted RNase H-like nuclease (RuvC/YqgF family)